MGVWAWLGRRRADDWFYHNRSQFALILGVAIIGQIAALVLGLTGWWKWPAGWLPTVTITDQVEALLATGTFALAFAALVQAVSGLWEVSARYRPSLTLALFDPSLPLNPILPGQQASVLQPGNRGSKIAVRNLGPGIAKDVKFSSFFYLETDATKSYFDQLGKTVPMVSNNFTDYRNFLDTTPESWWVIEIQPEYPVELEYTVEIEATNVFDQPVRKRTYHLHRYLTDDPAHKGEKAWSWSIAAPLDSDEA